MYPLPETRVSRCVSATLSRVSATFQSADSWNFVLCREKKRKFNSTTDGLNYIPYSFFKHFTRLPSRRAAEPLKYIPYSFSKLFTRLPSRRASPNNKPEKLALYSVVAPIFYIGLTSRYPLSRDIFVIYLFIYLFYLLNKVLYCIVSATWCCFNINQNSLN